MASHEKDRASEAAVPGRTPGPAPRAAVLTPPERRGQNGNGHGAPSGSPDGELLAALRAFRRGDFSVRLPGVRTGMSGEIAETFNDVVALSERMSEELAR